MRLPPTFERTLAASFIACVLACLPHRSPAQDFCPGDLDHDGVVTAADANVLLPILFVDPFTLEIDTLVRADVNDDGTLSGADIAAILALDGLPCPPPAPTPTSTPTPTATLRLTPTPTNTRPPTPTPTPTCAITQVGLGSTNGTLTATDCQRTVSRQIRPADMYSLSAQPGTAIKVELTTQAPLLGYLRIIDPGGQFETIEGVSPIQFTVTSGQPYFILVSSDPSSAVQLGNYTLTLTSTPCPTPVALALGSSRLFVLDGTECPEPAVPSVGTQTEPTDVYTFTVTSVPTNVSITMQQLSVNDDIFPVMALLGPDGFELVSEESDFDCTAPTGTLLCTQIRFLALRTGTYTLLAGGAGGTGRYSMTVASPTCKGTALIGIPTDHPLNCAECVGTLDGNTTHTPCAAPLPDPGNSDGLPDPSSPARLYTFTADAGDVISAKMISDDGDPHVYVLGPEPDNRLIAADDSTGTAQVAATLAVAGTYTIVVADNNALQSDDPAVNYTLMVQKCPFSGGLNPLTGRQVQGTYSTLDCVGSDDIPYRTYAFHGEAGQFVTTTMTSPDVDSLVRVFAPDGSVVENDDDPFQPVTSDARASRVLPMDGMYFVEVSASGPLVDVGAVPPPAFTLRARLCSTAAAAPGQINGTWEDADCDLGVGRRGDVYTFPAGTPPAVVSLSPPSNGCVLALLGNGSQLPDSGCSTTPLDVPVLGGGVHGVIVAGAETSTRGDYAVRLSRCPMGTIGFGEERHGVLSGSSCADADGIRAEWLLMQVPAGLALFNFEISGQLSANFPFEALLSDRSGAISVSGAFLEDPAQMFSVGTNLAAVWRVTGATPTDRGAYDLAVDPAALRQ